jgi:catechol 2,3-dioxygenase
MSNYHTSLVSHINQIGLTVSNLSTSLAFYTNILGLSILDQTATTASLGVTHRVVLTLSQASDAQRVSADHSGLYHFALLLPNFTSLASLFKHMLKQGARFQGASDHLISNALYLSDPDGYGIELAADTDPSTWPWRDDQLDIFAHNKALDVDRLYACALDEPFRGIHPDTILGHIHLHVDKLADSKAFYTQLLKMDVVIELPESALFLSFAHYHHHIAINRWNPRSRPNTSKGAPLLVLYLYTPSHDMDALKNRLVDLNVAFESTSDGIKLNDPNGFSYLIHSTYS